MKINCKALPAAFLIAPVLALAGCSGSPPQPSPAPRRAVIPPPVYRPPALPRPASPTAPQPRTNAASWRDLPQTAGSWNYTAETTGSAVRFGQPGAPALLTLRCDRSRPALVLQRPGLGAGQVPATITTSSTVRRLSAVPAGAAGAAQNAAVPFEIVLAVRDPLLDAIAFSRGRFMLEMGGAQTLVLPAWSELGRVIEDCR